MIICFENILEDSKFDRIYLCTNMDMYTACKEIKNIDLDDLTDPDGFDLQSFEDPFLLSYIYAN